MEGLKRADRREEEEEEEREREEASLVGFEREEGEEESRVAEVGKGGQRNGRAKANQWDKVLDQTDQDWIANQELLE